MARKKMRRFGGGGASSAQDEIVVNGKRPSSVEMLTNFDLSRMLGAMPHADGGGGFGGTGGGASQRLTALTPPAAPARASMAVTPAVVRAPQSQLSQIMGDKAPKGYGARFRMGFAGGGKANDEPTGGKKRTKAKKYATGGKASSASKRADGCATKGKTKGRFV